MADDHLGMTIAAGATTGTKTLRQRRRRALIGVMVASDYIAIMFAGLLAAAVRFGSIFVQTAVENAPIQPSFVVVSIGTALVWVLVMAANGLYDLDRVMWSSTETGRVARSLSMGMVVLILLTYVSKTPGLSRTWMLLSWLFAVIMVLLVRSAISFVVVILRRHGRMLYPTLVVGSNTEAADILRILKANRDAGLVPIGCLTSSVAEKLELDYCSEGTKVLGAARDLLEVLETNPVDTIVIASSAFDHDVLARMIAELRGFDVDVHISSGLFEVLTSRVLVNEVAGVPLITVKGVPLSQWKLLVKRLFDLGLALLLVLAGLPIWVVLALAVKFTSRGPILYGQERIGRQGMKFKMLKFRSMYVDADRRKEQLALENEATGPIFKIRDDPRITPVGKWMRKYSLDEFPQLINVVIGQMSLVGPRPPLPDEVRSYSRHEWRRLEVTPGMTGLWQISGRSALTFDEMVRLDLFYIENWSVSLDMALLMRTLPAVLLARGAY